MVSRRSRGRPCIFREAIKDAACRAASASKGTICSFMRARTSSNRWLKASRRLLLGIICKPNRISKIVIAVVHRDDRGCLSSHPRTFEFGECSINSDTTFVSRIVILRSQAAGFQTLEVLELAHRVQRRQIRPPVPSRARIRIYFRLYAPRRAECHGLPLPCFGRYDGRDAASAPSLRPRDCERLVVP